LEMYAVFPGVDKLTTNPKTAEMIKYTANSLLATMISFSNEIGNLCAALGDIDVVDVMKGVHLDKRLTPILPNGERVVPAFTSYLEAGCGFGGSCFPKDVKALVAHGQKNGRSMQLLNAVIQINKKQPEKIISLLNKHFPELDGVDVAVLGLAFKPGTDDMRESPAIPVVNYLLKQGAQVKAYDQVAKHEAFNIFGNGQICYCDDLEETLAGVDAVVLLTGWQEFEKLPALLAEKETQPVVVDGRRMIDKNSVARYEGIGLNRR
ncbi:MAG TPA: UDP-glucose/GDP-mannose dehydrogenase family protein, partial [Anaerolineae bacterium]|nr:UDP-glucose/GDP-mannose dehydrogenase family protein [Anaerolineae bacterium]